MKKKKLKKMLSFRSFVREITESLEMCFYVISPALFETIVRSLAPCLSIAPIRFSGIPHKPKPPTNNFAPSGISLTASLTSLYIFLLLDLLVENLHVSIYMKWKLLLFIDIAFTHHIICI